MSEIHNMVDKSVGPVYFFPLLSDRWFARSPIGGREPVCNFGFRGLGLLEVKSFGPTNSYWAEK